MKKKIAHSEKHLVLGFLLAFCFRLTVFLSIKAIHPFCFSIGDILLPSPLKSPLSDRKGQVTTTNGQHTTLIWDQSFADPRYFSDINVLLSFTLSFSSICPLVSKGGYSLICLINHLWQSARSLIHSNLSVACYKPSSPDQRRTEPLTLWSTGTTWVHYLAFSVFFMWILHHTGACQPTLLKCDKMKEHQPWVWWTGTFTLLCDDTDW